MQSQSSNVNSDILSRCSERSNYIGDCPVSNFKLNQLARMKAFQKQIDSESEMDIQSDRVIHFYDVRQRLPTDCYSPRVRSPQDFDETKTVNKITRVHSLNHGFKSPLKDELTRLKTKEGVLLKKTNPKGLFKKEYRAVIKDGIFQLFEQVEPYRMRLTLVFSQVQCNIDRVKDLLRIDVGGQTIWLKAKDQTELKEWMITFLFQTKLYKSQQISYILKQPKFYRYHFINSNEFQVEAQNLDIVLFKSKNIGASMQRFMTGSDYDHVAMVLRTCEEEVYLFEANSDDGVGLWSWKNFLVHDWRKAFEKVVLRKLICQRSPARIEILQNFVRASLGKKYQLTISKLFKKKSVTTSDQSLNGRTFFCSELMAAALKKVGLLKNPELSSTQYWPKDFSQEKLLQLKENASYGHEMVLY